MSNILEIPQIPATPFDNMQNDLHIGFGTDTAARLQKVRWTDETRATKAFPDAVDTLMGEYIAAEGQEDRVYELDKASDYTKRRQEKDQERDVLQKEITKTVETFATLTIFPEKQQKALVMLPVMRKYNIQPDGGIEAQTVATDQWLQEQMRNYQCELAAKELGIFESIKQLKALNDEIKQLTADRNDERAQKTTAELRTARQATDRAFNALRLMVNAQAITADYAIPLPDGTAYHTDISKEVKSEYRYFLTGVARASVFYPLSPRVHFGVSALVNVSIRRSTGSTTKTPNQQQLQSY